MRITGGEWRGRRLQCPAGQAVRPTQDRVREALFSMLGDAVRRAVFVDLFAGTGGVGLEALSRGAARAIWVERDRRAGETLRRNVRLLTGSDAGVVCREALQWLRGAGAALQPDILFADPPYAWGREGLQRLVAAAAAAGCPRPGGLMVLEQRAGTEERTDLPGFELLRDRRYGQSRLLLLRAAGRSENPCRGEARSGGPSRQVSTS